MWVKPTMKANGIDPLTSGGSSIITPAVGLIATGRGWPMFWLFAAIIGLPAVLKVLAAAFVRWRADRLTKEVAQTALQGCPPDQRADVLRAVAELAHNLGPSTPDR